MANSALPQFKFHPENDEEMFQIEPGTGKMVVVATGIKTQGQIESEKLDCELTAEMEQITSELGHTRNTATSEIIKIGQQFSRETAQCIERHKEQLKKSIETKDLRKNLTEFEKELPTLQKNTNRQVQDWKTRHERNIEYLTQRLDAMERDFSQKLQHFKQSSNTYTLMVSLENRDNNPVMLKKQDLSCVASELQTSLELTLIGIDDRLWFIFEAPVRQKSTIQNDYDTITQKLQTLFKAQVAQNPRKRRCVEGPNLGISSNKKLAVLLGKESDIKMREFRRDFTRWSAVVNTYRLSPSNYTPPDRREQNKTCITVHPCQDCGQECHHSHTCKEPHDRKIIHGPKAYTAICDICANAYWHSHTCSQPHETRDDRCRVM